MTTYYKHYRAAAADYEPPMGRPSTTRGLNLAEQAERDLRARLAVDPDTPSVLIAPERATLEHIEYGGLIPHSRFAWTEDSPWMGHWLHSPHVLAELEATRADPDPSCEHYAAHGSRLIHRPRLVRLHVSPFLAPVAAAWRERWGVEVNVLGGEDVPAPSVPELPALVVPDLLRPETCEVLWRHFQSNTDPGIPSLPCRGIEAPPEIVQPMTEALGQAAAAFGVPMTYATGQLMNYLPGEKFTEHTDSFPGLALSLDRTVSASVLLNAQGTDYTGGHLYVGGQMIEAGQGDAVFFTAKTRHWVSEVFTGHRFVFVMFGEVIR